jgi:hypothetical protein
MRALSPAQILDVWEAAASQHPLDRALTLLAAAGDGVRRQDLAALAIGERDRGLWELRERTFGPDVEGLTRCPACGERAAVQFRVSDVRAPSAGPNGREHEHELTAGEWTLRFRLPDSRDLAAVVATGDGETQLETHLAARCLLRAERAGGEAPPEQVPAEAWDAVQNRMAELDPQAEVRFDLSCPACSHRWAELFDIAGFLWAELSALARRLLREVDVLARCYGWGEQEILRLSAARRSAYLELARS